MTKRQRIKKRDVLAELYDTATYTHVEAVILWVGRGCPGILLNCSYESLSGKARNKLHVMQAKVRSKLKRGIKVTT